MQSAIVRNILKSLAMRCLIVFVSLVDVFLFASIDCANDLTVNGKRVDSIMISYMAKNHFLNGNLVPWKTVPTVTLNAVLHGLQ